MIKAVLFDMDGVLIDARHWHYDALNKALSHFGYRISHDDHSSTFDGLPTRDKLKILSSSRGLPAGLHDSINKLKQAYTAEISYQKCKPTFNHLYALTRLKDDGYKLAVCSNSIRKTIDQMMTLSGLKDYIEFFLSNEDVFLGKPDPEIYLKAMSMLELNPEECVIIEDNQHGILAAKASGAHLLAVPDPSYVTYGTIKSFIENLGV